MDWSSYAKLLSFLVVFFTIPRDDPDVSRLMVESLSFEGDRYTQCEIQDSSNKQPTVMARAAEYVSNLIKSGLWVTVDHVQFIESTSTIGSPSLCSHETGQLTAGLTRRHERYYLILASIIFKYSCRLDSGMFAACLVLLLSTYILMHHSSLRGLVTRCRDLLLNTTIQTISCILSSLDSMLMETVEILARGSTACCRTTLLAAVSSLSGVSVDSIWRHLGLHWSMTRRLPSMICMDYTYNSHESISSDLQWSESLCSSHKEDGVSSDITVDDDYGVIRMHECSIIQAHIWSPKSCPHLEGLFRLLLKSCLFKDIHSDIQYTLAILFPTHKITFHRFDLKSELYMLHFCVRRIVLLLICLIAYRFKSPVLSYRWLAGVLHHRIIISNHPTSVDDAQIQH